jgi:hypothetical protein
MRGKFKDGKDFYLRHKIHDREFYALTYWFEILLWDEKRGGVWFSLDVRSFFSDEQVVGFMVGTYAFKYFYDFLVTLSEDKVRDHYLKGVFDIEYCVFVNTKINKYEV